MKILTRSKLEPMIRYLALDRNLTLLNIDGRFLLNAEWDGYYYFAHRTTGLHMEEIPDCKRGTIAAEHLNEIDIAFDAIVRSLDRVEASMVPMPPSVVDRDPGDEDA